MPIHVALLLTLVGSLGLAALLSVWTDRVPGARLLVLFLVGVAAWVVGNELPTWLGPAAERAALMLMATAAVTSAVFLHFTLVFCGWMTPGPAVAAIYAVGVGAALVSVVVPSGTFLPFAGVALAPVPNGVGWTTSAVWAGLAGAGHLVLARAAYRRRGLARSQVVAVGASSAWGLVCMTGYGVAAFRLPIYPWPLLLLPAYPLILVYAILRYRVFVANAWARRALAWTLLSACALGTVALVPLLPLEGTAGRLASGCLVAGCCLALAGPVRRLAHRVVYPGGEVSADDLAAWRAGLREADSPADLAERATALLSRRLKLDVRASVGDDPGPDAEPRVGCRRVDDAWTAVLSGWDAAPPGPRRVAELFGAVLADEAGRLDRASLLAARERERLLRDRLAEIGQLAATVAHDVRNPLNIIGLAAAAAPAEVRADIREQVARIAALSRDLLDYAKPWDVEARNLDLSVQVRAIAARFPGVLVGAGLEQAVSVHADPRRFDQALINVLENAAGTGAAVAVEAEVGGGWLRLHVCDAGPGIPADLRDRIFKPFVSRSPGGTGLGLAIVSRIMAAHGGTASVSERPGWSTCVTLSFPYWDAGVKEAAE